MSAEPKCPDKACEHRISAHTPRSGCTAVKKGHDTGKDCACPCTRTWL